MEGKRLNDIKALNDTYRIRPDHHHRIFRPLQTTKKEEANEQTNTKQINPFSTETIQTTMSSRPVQLVFGGASFGPSMSSEFGSLEAARHALDLLGASGVKSIDTARIYPDSEAYLGQAGAAARFSIDTKYPGGFAPTASGKEGLIASIEESLKALKTEQVSCYSLP
jgi:diketogulonate reductase-like aldo/keto reductase